MASNRIEVLDPTATVEKIKKIVPRSALNRRNFMAAIGVTGAAAGAALVSGRKVTRVRAASTSGASQSDYFNYILNIKYLKGTYYSYVTTGADMPASVTAGGGLIYQTPSKVTFTGTNAQQTTDLFNEMYYDELNQLIALRTLLPTFGPQVGSAAIFRPALSLLGTGSTTAGAASPATTPGQAIAVARLLEDVEATAIAGIAPFLTGTNLTYAAQVLAGVAFRAGALRLIAIQQAAPYVQASPYVAPAALLYFSGLLTSGSPTITGVTSTAGVTVGAILTGVGIPANTTVAAIPTPSTSFGTGTITMSANATASTAANATTVIATNTPADPDDVKPADLGATLAAAGPQPLAGTSNPIVYQGFFNTTGAANATQASPTGTAFARTSSQVLTILYSNFGEAANAASSPAYPTINKGGFFPSGFAGVIATI